MNAVQLREHVDLIREVFLYTRRFTGSVFVIKIDYSIVDHSFFPILVNDIVLLQRMGIRIVIVPGASERIDQILSQNNILWKKSDGVRISSAEAMTFIKMAAFDVSNRVMTSLSGCGVNAVIGNWVRARGIGVLGGCDFQSSGRIEKIQSDQILNVLNEDIIPIFPCIGWNSMGEAYNLSSDELAYSISVELKAEKLFFIKSDDRFLQKLNLHEHHKAHRFKGRISRLNVDIARQFIEEYSSEIGEEDRLLLSLAAEACSLGVLRVHIIDGRNDGSILKEIFSNMGIGTMIHSNPYESFRLMTIEDISAVLVMMQPLIDKEILISRTEEDFYKNYRDYVVYEVDGSVHACGALHVYSEGSGEIAGIAVDQSYKGLGIGGKLVFYLLDKAREKGLKQVFVLTTQTTDWFLGLGFKPGTIRMIPEEKRVNYNNNRKSRILMFDLTSNKMKF